MNQTLHILKKDLRRHWPEILISLILLVDFTKDALHTSPDFFFGASSVGIALWRASREMVRPVLVLFWVFLILRVVHGETLVGDRQWWVTKPYEWWKLLLAKQLFLIVVISLPLFLVHIFLLHQAGFPVATHFPQLLHLQVGLAILLFIPCLTLGAVTRTLGQSLIGVGLLFVVITGCSAALSEVPSYGMSSAAESVEDLQGLLVFGSAVAVMGWQYARRRTWASRGFLFGAAAVVTLIGAVTPYATFVERKYPLVSATEAPAQFAARPVPPQKEKQDDAESSNVRGFDLRTQPRDTFFDIPLSVSGIVQGTLVQVEGVHVVIETPEGLRLNRGWIANYYDLWNTDSIEDSWYPVNREIFDKIKLEPVRVHVELALAEFHETSARDIIVQKGEFPDPDLGICVIGLNDSQLECRHPFSQPGLMVTLDPSQSSCPLREGEAFEDQISHAWFPPPTGGPDVGLNPVEDYAISMGNRMSMLLRTATGSRVRVVRFCPGAKIHVAMPELKRHLRVQIDLPSTRLYDLTNVNTHE